MKFYLFLLSSLLSLTLNAQWTNVNSSSNESWQELETPSSLIVYGRSYNNNLYKSTDEGLSWQQISLNFSNISNLDLQSIHFVDDSLGYLYLRGNFNQQLSAFVFKTDDGGSSWVDISPTNLALGFGEADLKFVDASKGFLAVGDRIYQTNDGGNSWTEEILFNGGGMRVVDFFDENHAIAGAWDGTFFYSGAIFTTNDGGATWDSLIFATAYSQIISVDFASANVAYALEEGAWNGVQKLYKSQDAGASWDSIQLTFLADSSDHANVIYFLNENKGYLLSQNAKIFYTEDGGLSWQAEHQENNANLQTMTSSGPKLFVGGGQNVLLVKTLTTSTQNIEAHIDNQLFPNPVRRGEALNFKAAETGLLEIYNLAGQLIHQESLENQQQISTNQLVSGLYLIKISGKETNYYKIVVE